MRKLLHAFFISFIITTAFPNLVFTATNYYVSTNGSDSNSGTSTGSPLLTVAAAINKAAAGDTIFVRAGIYPVSATIRLTKSGTGNSKYYLFVYPGDQRPILDFSSMAIGSSNRGFSVSGSYWHVKGIRIKGAGDNGMNISGAYNIIEFCDFFENRDGGCQLGGGAHDNRIINCDSYLNADYVEGNTSYTGGNADGFSPKLDVGTNNYFYGCRAWLNSDDGWDGYLRPSDNVTTILENCWTWKNGYLKDGVTTTSSMNGNGFKLGGSDTKDLRHNFIVKNCLAFYNKANGFDQNSNTGSITIFNGTSFNNKGRNFYLNSSVTLPAGSVFTVKNCIALGSTGTSFRTGTVLATNQFSTSSTDFVSTDTTGVTAPRKADGSLPDILLMHPVAGALIDAGTDVGLPYNGSKPDLGYFESGNSTTSYTLTTGIASGSGTVTPDGKTRLFSSNYISLTATPSNGYAFDKWTGETGATLSTSNPYTISMNGGNLTVNANFLAVQQYTLTTSVTGGNGTIAPASGTKYNSGTSVILTATPAANYTFVSWGGNASGTSPSTTITMNADMNVTALFALVKRTLTTVVSPSNSGSISPVSGSTYDHGSGIKLTAMPAAGYVFDKWVNSTGTTLSTYDTLTIRMDADKTITGFFKFNTGINSIEKPDDIRVFRSSSGGITVSFSLDIPGQVSFSFFSVEGKLIQSIPARSFSSGNHSVDLKSPTLFPGIYLCRININGKTIIRKIALM